MVPRGDIVTLPAAIPATFDPCPFWSRASEDDRRKDFAAITLLLVSDSLPLFVFGNPAGIVNPASENKGLVISIPVSRIAILIPCPAAPIPPMRSQSADV